MEVVYKHKIYCETDSKWEYKLSESETLLTACPTNAGHTVTTGSSNIDSSIKPTDTRAQKIMETGGPDSIYVGFQFTANTTTYTHDEKITENCYLDWGHVEVVGSDPADYVEMLIIDKDAVRYPANTVLIQYVYNANIGADGKKSFPKDEPQRKATEDLKDLYIRTIYHRATTGDRTVLVDLSGDNAL